MIKSLSALFKGRKKTNAQTTTIINNMKRVDRLDELYQLGKELGSGGFATVVLGTDKTDGSTWALKLIKMSVFKSNQEATEKEVEMLASLNHPGVVRLREVILTDKYFVIVMELLGGGELFERIVQREKYGENDAKTVAAALLDTLIHLHEKGIVHRDLKPENLIFDRPGEDATLKLTDFGFATLSDPKNKLTATCGTPEYVAPEILNEQPYDVAVDVWSAGVIIYILLCGFPPFFGDNDDQLFDRICNCQYEFLRPYWDPISADAKELIKLMLDVNPAKRLTAKQARDHKWFKNVTAQADLTGALEEMRRYNATRKLKKGVLVILATNKVKAMIGEL